MRYLKSLGFLLLLSTVGNAQDEKYKTLVKEFIEYISIKNSFADTIVLGVEPNTRPLSTCAWIFSDTNLINNSEKESILLEINNPLIKEWTNELVTKTKFISWKNFTNILRDSAQSWPYFYKNYGPKFITYSLPIFFRNYTMCLFYWERWSSGWGTGRMALYRKVNDEWIIVKEFCGWDAE